MMKSDNIFDHVPTILALLTVYIMVGAILYNFGFLGVYGLNNIGILTLSDHIQSVIVAVPYYIFMLVFMGLGIKLIDYLIMKKLFHYRDTSFHWWRNKAIRNVLIWSGNLFTAALLLGFLYLGLDDAFRLPHNARNAELKSDLDSASWLVPFLSFLSMFCAGTIWYGDVKILRNLQPMQKFLLAVAPVFWMVAFERGVSDAKGFRDKVLTENIYIDNNPHKGGVIVRYLEKGILLYSQCELSMELISWDKIGTIKYRHNNQKQQGCV